MAGLAAGGGSRGPVGSRAEKKEDSPGARAGGQTWCRMEGRTIDVPIFRRTQKRHGADKRLSSSDLQLRADLPVMCWVGGSTIPRQGG